ncbi:MULTISPECIES: FAD/NAD(P)-binding protein [unclassified Nostoc]|uniref:FAD/NAD(P)-binding protein n=1 Tax=unclassified Nostoc TaxID=2593658 RepID=UPI002AD3AA7F|nr:FAD/NAD(P)-binding protein [Nostoc sp. DedQUE03]MDZ7976332.1 FAD/NAD(P)-binding protein [Nostoc sp. DedQUE03]MDZ8047946.1 FAD/NAD(P)-binding protein [Nostoc sp. DedQUE02]
MHSNVLIAHPSTTTIALVGAGFSGSLVAAHLLKTANRPLLIKLIERSHDIGKGVAYSTDTISHLLNVSAGKMSAFPDDPSHLLRWLNYNRSELGAFLPSDLNASSFIPRQIFGLYIQSILEEAEATASSNVRLERVIDEVVAVEPQAKGAIVSLSSSRTFVADKIVLALGNAPSAPPGSQPSEDNDTPYLRHAWSAEALAELEPDAPVLLIGTGLTMVDMVVSLHDRNHRGKIYAVSRRGLSPLPHQSTKPYPAFLTPDTAPKTVRGLLRRIRSEVQTAAVQGYNWRSVIDSLRPITQQLWQQLPRVEQKRLLRHVTPYWDVHRHRIAPKIGKIVQAMLDSGQLTITAGRIQGYQAAVDAVAVTVRQRQTQRNQVLQVSRVVNCTGVQANYQRSPQPLIANLRTQGLIRPNDIGLGLDTTPDGAVLDAQSKRSSLLYTLGTPRKGNLWETIAVPELREQAQALATTVLQSLPVRVRPVSPISRATEQNYGDLRPAIPQSTLLFRQFFDPESSTYTYLIADSQTKDAVLVDTVLEQVDRDLQVLDELGLSLCYCLETHIHADHITGAGKLRQQTGCQVIVPQNATARSADHSLADRETLIVGAVRIEAIATPGHTDSHLAYLVNNTHLLTGDALLIRGCGRTDFQSGDAGTLYDTVTQQLFTLPEETLVYPAHDYKGQTVSTIGEEKRLNPRFANRSRDQFIAIMSHLGLSYPKKMNEAVPANEYCGDFMPEASLSNGTSLVIDVDREKVEKTLSTNTEIYEDYFAMYI